MRGGKTGRGCLLASRAEGLSVSPKYEVAARPVPYDDIHRLPVRVGSFGKVRDPSAQIGNLTEVSEIKMALSIGAKFESYDEVAAIIKDYQAENFVQLYKRDSRTIEAASRRCSKKIFAARLRYSELDYSCIHGGKKFESESKGARPNVR
jgi:hypothetical protein